MGKQGQQSDGACWAGVFGPQAGTFGQKAMFATGSEAASASSIQATVRLLGWAFPAPEATPLG